MNKHDQISRPRVLILDLQLHKNLFISFSSQNILNSYRISPSVKKHDQISRPWVSILDFAFVAVRIERQLPGVKSL